MILATVGQMVAMLDELGIPNAQMMWGNDDDIPKPPYVLLKPLEANNLHTDGTVTFEAIKYDLELYSKTRDIPLEKRIKAALRQAEVDYDTDYAPDDKGQVIITYFHVTLTEQEAS